MSNLYEASYQWAKRPDDERYSTVAEMRDACRRYADSAVVSFAPLGSLRVEADATDLMLLGEKSIPATLTHHAFGQLSRLAGAPAAYLRELPAPLAATLINHGIQTAPADKKADRLNLLFHKNGHIMTRALTSDSYDRVWNWEVLDKVQHHLIETGWRVPPARPAREGQKGSRFATVADILPNQKEFGLEVKVGDLIAPAGLYASDHDMFAFLVNQDTEAQVWDGNHFLNRGVFIQNSEVGDCSLRFKIFTYDNVCGNHIVWGVGEVTEIAVRHMKGEKSAGRTLRNAFAKWHVTSAKLPSASTMEQGISAAKSKQIAATKDEVLDAVFAFGRVKRLNLLNREALEAAYTLAEQSPRYGSPRSVWGIVNGLTEYSQSTQYTDERTALDQQAGRVMEMAF